MIEVQRAKTAAALQDYCLKELTKKFPSSLRVERLKGWASENLPATGCSLRVGIEKESLADWKEAKSMEEV